MGHDTKRRINERGSSLIELTIALPILLALAFGIVTFATAHEQKVSLTNAAREGARYGATLPYSSTWATQVENVVTASATGDLAASAPGRFVCVEVYDGSTWQGNNGGACFTDGLTDARVQVLARRTGSLETFFFRRSVTMTGKAVVRFEDAG
jgi:Flp pilus assembly protein TadG